jgi:two-component system, OmpR family, aerobic respiration control sensor histidine kinase ArcB
MKDNAPSMQAIIEKLPGNIWWKDKELHYLGCNQHVLNVLGLSQEQFIGKRDHDLWDPEIADRLLQADRQVLQTGQEVSLEEIITEKDDTKVIMLTKKTPYYDEEGRLAGIIGISIDISARKRAEKALRESKEAAEAANAAKAAFLDNIRHDLRTPLTGIIGCAEAIKRGEDIQEFTNDLITSCQALLTVLNGILAMTTVTAIEGAKENKKFNLKATLQNIIDLNQAKAREKRLNLIMQYDDSIPHYLMGDVTRIERILLELVTNALNFTNKGHVKLIAQLARKNSHHIILKIEVKDTGIGIARDKQAMIFSQFQRITPAYKGIYPGAGLGLALVKQLVDEIEGEVYLESKPEKGSVFTCVIPLKEALLDEPSGMDNPSPPVVSGKKPGKHKKSIRILLVEDTEISAKVVKSLLLSLGCHDVDIAPNGKSALKQVRQHKYTFMILDIGLPDMSGVEVAKSIRTWNKHLPIVGLTAHIDQEKEQACLQAGMEKVLSKPLNVRTALEILKAFVHKK